MGQIRGLAVHPDEDFALWLEGQVMLLRERRFDLLDLAPLIDELEVLVKNQRRELKSRLRTIILHLLKWEYQPGRRTASWQHTLFRERQELEDLFELSPSLRNAAIASAEQAYAGARRGAAAETQLPAAIFPSELPYTAEQLLDDNFFP